MTTSRRFIGGLIRFALVLVAVAFVGAWISHHVHHTRTDRRTADADENMSTVQTTKVSVERSEPATLGAGDVRIYNTDSTVDLLLAGNSIYAGLSPAMVDKIKSGLDSSAAGDSTGLGGSISRIVKQSVAGAIGTHAVYRVSDVRELHYEDGRIVVDWKDGRHQDLFGTTKVNGKRASNTFRDADAKRFIDAVHARMQQPASGPNQPQ